MTAKGRAVSDWFADAFADLGLSEFFGSGPIPPESVARGILGIGPYLPLDRDGIKAAFRFQVKILRPDLTDSAADRLRRQDAEADRVTRLAELLWARDDLIRRVPKPVTGNGPVATDTGSRNDQTCPRCHSERRTSTGETFGQCWGPGRWYRFCWPCRDDAENERRRELRRQARANRRCQGCTRTFTGSRSDAVYCSSACRQKAYRQRGGGS